MGAAHGDKLTDLDKLRNSRQIVDAQYYAKRDELIGKGGYIFETDEDIIKVVDHLASRAEDTNVFPVRHVRDPRRMVQLGLWPTSIKLGGPWIAEWLAGEDMRVIEFWSTKKDVTIFTNNLRDEMNWRYKTLETLKREAVERASSIALKMYAPELLYKESNRPITDMSLFRSPLSLTCKREDIVASKIAIEGEAWQIAPVTRYALGMSKGLYYSDDTLPVDICGTSYYMEPKSTTLLAYKTSLKAFNKTNACRKLGVRTEAYSEIEDHIEGDLPLDLMMTPEETGNEDGANLPPVPHYAAEYLGLYAAEDHLDQPLCIAARNAGYDIVVLENMVGSFQIVTEVLDTRSREDSFKSLVYIIA